MHQLPMLSYQLTTECPDLIQATCHTLDLTVQTMRYTVNQNHAASLNITPIAVYLSPFSGRLMNAQSWDLLEKLIVVASSNLSTLSLQFPPTHHFFQQYFYHVLKLCSASTR